MRWGIMSCAHYTARPDLKSGPVRQIWKTFGRVKVRFGVFGRCIMTRTPFLGVTSMVTLTKRLPVQTVPRSSKQIPRTSKREFWTSVDETCVRPNGPESVQTDPENIQTSFWTSVDETGPSKTRPKQTRSVQTTFWTSVDESSQLPIVQVNRLGSECLSSAACSKLLS